LEISAEIRWWWREHGPTGLEEWFCRGTAHTPPAGGGIARRDEYLRDPNQDELGIKRRGGQAVFEVKGLVAIRPDALDVGPFSGPIELWAKWRSATLELDPGAIISTEKQRWMRKFETGGAEPFEIALDSSEKPVSTRPLPEFGCNAEFTRVSVGQERWWTFGFESFGTLSTVEDDLHAVAAVLADRHPPPSVGGGLVASYPTWLCDRQT
jgi:hypothetical protein